MTSKTGDLSGHRVLVTGVCGFLGSRMAEALLNRGAVVTGVDLKSACPEKLAKHKSYFFIQRDFLKKNNEVLFKWDAENREDTAVFHMAGLAHVDECEKNPRKAFESNVLLTSYVLEFCRLNKIRNFIFPSTGLVYGTSLKEPAAEDTPPAPQNFYAVSKLAAEVQIRGYSLSFGISCIIARLGNTYGPGSDPDTLVSTIVDQIKKKEKIVVRHLTPIRDFIYIDDVLEGLIRLYLSKDKKKCQVVNVSTGAGTSALELARMASQISSIPIDEALKHRDPFDSTLVLNNSLLAKIAGWTPKYTLSEGLSLTLQSSN